MAQKVIDVQYNSDVSNLPAASNLPMHSVHIPARYHRLLFHTRMGALTLH